MAWGAGNRGKAEKSHGGGGGGGGGGEETAGRAGPGLAWDAVAKSLECTVCFDSINGPIYQVRHLRLMHVRRPRHALAQSRHPSAALPPDRLPASPPPRLCRRRP